MNATINTKYRDFAEKKVAPTFKKANIIEVEFLTEGCLIEKYSKVEYAAISYALCQGAKNDLFTEDEFLLYNKSAVYSRIGWVNSSGFSFGPNDHIMIPSFLMNIIMQIGKTQDSSLGLTVIPKDAPKDFKPMDIDRMREISMWLENLSGYEGGFGYPSDKSGSFEFMTMTLVDNEIRRHDSKAHPVYAMMASVVGPKYVATILSPIITYGNTEMFEGLLWQLTSI